MTMTDIERDFVISRIVQAPRARVWRAYSEADQLTRWWGPKGAAIRVLSLDFRPGGMFHYAMEFQPGHPIYGRFVYGLIRAPERLEYVNAFSDENGGLTRAPFPQLRDSFPLEFHNVVTFAEKDGTTIVTARSTPINASPAEISAFVGMFDSIHVSFTSIFDKLDALLCR
ncbi:SRPBCC family protein [Pseudorhodoplanes sp.]|uniref:SRPBCC family protein n=1 Tax=Pseudorhodoplanes sp. TaxID=1934341 RepID=UPI003D13FBC6